MLLTNPYRQVIRRISWSTRRTVRQNENDLHADDEFEPDEEWDVFADESEIMKPPRFKYHPVSATFNEHHKAAMDFLTTEAQKFYQPQHAGVNYISGTDIPFPTNPFFKPKTPLSGDKKKEIWEAIIGGEDIRTVSNKFGVSVERIVAVIRLHKMANYWVTKGKKPLYALSRSLYPLLQTSSSIKEGTTTMQDFKRNPLWGIASESRNPSPKDAAQVLGRSSFVEDIDSAVEKAKRELQELQATGLFKPKEKNIIKQVPMRGYTMRFIEEPGCKGRRWHGEMKD